MKDSENILAISEEAKTLFLFLALKGGPVSLNEIVSLNILNPVDLWDCFEKGVENELLVKDSDNTHGTFAIANEFMAGEMVAISENEVWKTLFIKTTIADEVFAEKEYSQKKRRVCYMYVDYRFSDDFIESDSQSDILWVQALSETILFHANTWLSTVVYEEAIKISIDYGDLKSQAIYYSTMGVKLLSEDREEDSRYYIKKAEEVTRSLGDSVIMVHVMRDISFAMMMSGRIGRAITYNEDVIETATPLRGDVANFLPETELLKKIVRLNEAENGLIAYAYYLAGQMPKAVEMLHNMISIGQNNKNDVTIEAANIFLGMIYADRHETEKAYSFVENKFDFWKEREDISSFTWALCIVLASIGMQKKSPEIAIKYLTLGHKYRTMSKFPHHFCVILMETLEWLDEGGYPEIAGISLDSELKRLMDWPDIYMKGVALRFLARKKLARGLAEENLHEILTTLDESDELLTLSEGIPQLLATIKMKITVESHLNNHHAIAKLTERYKSLLLTISGGHADEMQKNEEDFIAVAIEKLIDEIARFSSINRTGNRPWNSIINKIGQMLGAEKCRLVESEDLQTNSEIKPVVTVESQLVRIPFSTQNPKKQHALLIENRYTSHSFRTEHIPLLEKLGTQMGIVMENILLWQELQETRIKLENENRYYRERSDITVGQSSDVIGTADNMKRVLGLIERVAPMDSAVLLLGETGSGKEVAAKEIHKKSRRSDRQFIVAHLASIAPDLVASTMFGHEKGAFTGAVSQMTGLFEMADKGTIFLDEIGDLSLDNQVRLLRVLQEGTFERLGSVRPIKSDFRLIAATNRDILADVKKGLFREDLYYRLNVFPIQIPPLRERKSDLPALALLFMNEYSKKMAKEFTDIREKDMKSLVEYSWPGNVRELRHIIERACILSDPPLLIIPTIEVLPLAEDNESVTELSPLESVIKNHIKTVLLHTKGKIYGKDGAAEILGLKPPTLYMKINQLHLRDMLKSAQTGE